MMIIIIIILGAGRNVELDARRAATCITLRRSRHVHTQVPS
jgi:hypothetical protein